MDSWCLLLQQPGRDQRDRIESKHLYHLHSSPVENDTTHKNSCIKGRRMCISQFWVNKSRSHLHNELNYKLPILKVKRCFLKSSWRKDSDNPTLVTRLLPFSTEITMDIHHDILFPHWPSIGAVGTVGRDTIQRYMPDSYIFRMSSRPRVDMWNLYTRIIKLWAKRDRYGQRYQWFQIHVEMCILKTQHYTLCIILEFN